MYPYVVQSRLFFQGTSTRRRLNVFEAGQPANHTRLWSSCMISQATLPIPLRLYRLHSRVLFSGTANASMEEIGANQVIYYLSGLTCTDENFIQKSGAQRMASQLNIALVAPDTSPRGLGVEGEDDSYDFGTGAGFYVDATEEKWSKYRMYSYITKELPALLRSHVSNLDPDNVSIMGHSMGGHGALMIALKNPGVYKSVSAFAPICNPVNCPWGKKAFSGYLGTDENHWKVYDSAELLKGYTGPALDILVDVGTSDNFLKLLGHLFSSHRLVQGGQLLPEALEDAHKQSQASGASVALKLRRQEAYDHSYYTIATFVDDHIKHHARALGVV